MVDALTVQDLAQACRLFMESAYPDGPQTIPENRRRYFDIADDACIDDYLPPAKLALSVCQSLPKTKSGTLGYELRLGSMWHPHLKLRIQPMEFHERNVWVYSVDTHDRFFQATPNLSGEEAEAWKALVERNRSLKHQIETAFARVGYMTPIGLLRFDLTAPATPA